MHRIGAGRDQQRPVRRRAAVLETQPLAGDVESGDARAEPQVDALLLVVLGPAQRNPVFLRRARQVVLRQVGPVHRRIAVGADHRQRPVVALTAQHVGGREPGGATTNDHD